MSLRIFLFAVLLSVATCLSAQELPLGLQDLGLRAAPVPSRELPGWQTPTRVVVNNIFGQNLAAQFGVDFPGVEFIGVNSAAEAVAAVPGAQVVIGFCDQSIFAASDQLRWVQVFWAGVENCVSLPAMAQGGITLTNGQRLSGPAIAEHTLGLLFSLSRSLDGYFRAQLDQRWQPQYLNAADMGEIRGRTMLVVGLGGIGTQVAQRAHALGMRVIAIRHSRREGPDYVDYVGLDDELLALAAKADVVVNAAPLTALTEGIFNAAFFAAMKPSAYFISVGRGQSTVTADLVQALRSNTIAGAALDVIEPEPLPDNDPLWSVPGLIITPHVAAQSRETLQRVQLLVVENLRRYIAGEPLLSVVDVQSGY